MWESLRSPRGIVGRESAASWVLTFSTILTDAYGALDPASWNVGVYVTDTYDPVYIREYEIHARGVFNPTTCTVTGVSLSDSQPDDHIGQQMTRVGRSSSCRSIRVARIALFFVVTRVFQSLCRLCMALLGTQSKKSLSFSQIPGHTFAAFEQSPCGELAVGVPSSRPLDEQR